MNPLITNYFAIGDAIANKLQAEVTDVKAVLTPFSMDDALESSQHTPALFVIYAGDSVADADAGSQGLLRFVDQKWLVVLAVRHAGSQLQKTSEIRNLAGTIIPKILTSLSGWIPAEFARPLIRTTAPPPGYSSAFAYFPFQFLTRLTT